MGSGKTTGLRSILLLRWRLVSRTGEALCTSLRFLGRETPQALPPCGRNAGLAVQGSCLPQRKRRPGIQVLSGSRLTERLYVSNAGRRTAGLVFACGDPLVDPPIWGHARSRERKKRTWGADGPGVFSQLCRSLAACPWASYLTSLSNYKKRY